MIAGTCTRCLHAVERDSHGTLIDGTGGDVCGVIFGDNAPHTLSDALTRDQTITALYFAASNDSEATVLTDLLLAAGLRWKCANDNGWRVCAWINVPEDETCDNCGEDKKA